VFDTLGIREHQMTVAVQTRLFLACVVSLAAITQACAEGDRGVSGAGAVSGVGGYAGVGGAAGFAGMGGAAGFAGMGGAGGAAGFAGTGGAAGMAGMAGVGGDAGAAGMSGVGGSGGVGGTAGMAGSGGSSGVGVGGTCCNGGDCLCHGPNPAALTSASGPFHTTTFTISTGTVRFPDDAEPPFAAVAVCGGFTNTGPEMAPWSDFYASHGIVTVIVTTLGSDSPQVRATKLLAAITELKAENTDSSSPLFGKLAGRYGTSGYSMGGGGTTIATTQDMTLRTSIGLAPWTPTGTGVQVPTLLLCGTADGTAPCSMAQGAYTAISGPKMMISITGATHFNWFGPTNAGAGLSGQYALAFQKVFLEGDERWRPLLLQTPTGGTRTTTIQ